MSKYLEMLKELERKVLVKNGYITIKTPSGWDYEIELSRICGERAILGWLRHLSEKTWFTSKHACDFIDAACRYNNIDPHELP